MADTDTCPTCSAVLPADAPEGACPACLMAGALSEDDAIEEADRAVPEGVEHIAPLFPELEIIAIRGRGGMGTVYEARHKKLDRSVALKILTVGGEDAPAFAERFAREARALARLDHPHIVRVYEYGERDGVCFLMMEYVDGVNLREAMHAGELKPEQAISIVPQVCDALQYAHDNGVVHRDIKPENVLIGKDGVVKIADFGLAKLTSGTLPEVTLTRAGQVMGTLHYMAPEQIESPLIVDHRADIYSLGVVFYEMLTGELPLGRFDPPSHRVQMDVRLDEVVLRTLEKHRERRYQTAADLKSEVDNISTTDAPPPPPEPSPPRAPRDANLLSEDSQVSRKALLGMLAVPAAGVVTVAGGLISSSLGGWRTLSVTFMPVVGLMLLAGLILSVWGWMDIRRSRGRLRGTWMAATGVLLPLLCPFPALLLVMGLVHTAPQVVAVPAPPVPVTVEPPIRTLWNWAVENHGDVWSLDDPLAYVDPDSRHLIPPAATGPGYGLLFFPEADLPEPLSKFGWNINHHRGKQQRVVCMSRENVLTFPVVERDGRLYFGVGDVEVRKRGPEDNEER